MSTNDTKNKILNIINELGLFVYDPTKWDKYGKALYQLINDNIIIGLDQIENTKNFMNSLYMYTYADNRFNLQIKNIDNWDYTIVKGKELKNKKKK